jgi:hypothetical protein
MLWFISESIDQNHVLYRNTLIKLGFIAFVVTLYIRAGTCEKSEGVKAGMYLLICCNETILIMGEVTDQVDSASG